MSSIVGIEDGLTDAPVASSSYGIVAAKDDVQADRDATIDCGNAPVTQVSFNLLSILDTDVSSEEIVTV